MLSPAGKRHHPPGFYKAFCRYPHTPSFPVKKQKTKTKTAAKEPEWSEGSKVTDSLSQAREPPDPEPLAGGAHSPQPVLHSQAKLGL